MFAKAWSIAYDTVTSWWGHQASTLGAAIAYYSAFSLAPILLLVVSIAGLFFGEQAAEGAIADQLSGLIGAEGAQIIQAMVADARNVGSGIIGTVVGVVLLLLLATGALGQIQTALNIVWNAEAPQSAFWATLRSRLFSLALISSLGFLLLVSLVVDAALSSVGDYVFRFFPPAQMILLGINFLVSLFFAILLFGLVYWLLPDAPLTWRDVLPGAVLAGVLFTLGKFVIGMVVGRSGLASTFGAAAAILTVLAWVYYTSQILLLGAEFSRAYRYPSAAATQPAAAQ